MTEHTFQPPDLNATIRIEILGLAVCCYNAAYHDPASGRRGRWEVAVPRVSNHELTLRIGGCGLNRIDRTTRLIEIKNRTVVPVDNPTHQHPQRFSRNDPRAFPLDFRWITGFTDRDDLPHGRVTPRREVDVTMFYIYDATFYSALREPFIPVVRATHDETGRVSGDYVIPVPEHQAGPILDASFELGYVASVVLADVHSPQAGGGAVDILFGTQIRTTITQGPAPRNVVISNLEPDNTSAPDGFSVRTPEHRYGRGDAFRYYRLFRVEGPMLHLWERAPISADDSGDARTGDCNGTRVDLPNLDALLH